MGIKPGQAFATRCDDDTIVLTIETDKSAAEVYLNNTQAAGLMKELEAILDR